MTDHLFILSAANDERLQAYARRVLAWLETPAADARWADALYTWQVGRTAMKRRLAMKVGSPTELAARLDDWLRSGLVPADAWIGDATPRVSADAAETRLVEDALARTDLAELAAVWTSGAEIDWQKLHASGEKRRRISVPTYPFARERHWVELGGPAMQPVAAHAAAAPAAPTPTPDAIEPLFVTPVWRTAETRASSPAATATATATAVARHHVFLCEMAGLDAAALEAELSTGECCDLSHPEQENLGERYVGYALSCFQKLREILAGKPRAKVLCQLVIPDQPDSELLVGLSGMLRTAGQENPQLTAQIVIVNAGSARELAHLLTQERNRLEDGIIRWSGATRQVLQWRDVAELRGAAGAASHATFRDDGVYLVTGGSGGLGALFVREILQRAARPIIIVTGRAPAAQRPAILDTLSREAVERGASPIVYRELDLANRDAVRACVAGIQREFQRLNGIIHCAGMVADAFMLNKSGEELRRVLAPKVLGTVNLDDASREIELDFLVLFSSAVSVTGHAGQADYAAANGFMDHFAAWRNRLVGNDQRRGQTLTINWPLWLEGGMVMDAATQTTLRASVGAVPMGTATGMRVFHESLALRCGRTLVIEGELPKLRAMLARTTTSSPALAAAARSDLPPGAGTGGAALAEETLRKLKLLLGEVIKRPVAQIDVQEELSAYGIDSIIINTMNFRLSQAFGEISKTLFFEYKTLKDLCAHLTATYPAECARWTGVAADAPVAAQAAPPPVPAATVPNTAARDTGPIAIVGISGIYPRAATLDQFWANLAAGENCVGEIPPERWDLDDFYTPDVDQAVEQGKSYSKWGGFIDQFSEFDPLFFNISPREAMNMDPQERLFLQECWRALEDAGYTRADLKHRFRQRVGVFAGITKSGFNLHAAPNAGEPFLPYTSFGSTANRVSYLMDITGPSLPIDTMCSSSLTAIHEACEYLRRGDCEMAFAGGVNLYLHPYTYQWLSQQRMLSRDGLCRSFGAGGNGYVPGEGVGVVLLKPLSGALRDNDHIHGVILATHVNHSGRTSGYTVPSPVAQAELIRGAMEKAGIEPRDVSYIEAHGTGTELGDPIEITGLTQAFGTKARDTGHCRIGSAKSNIGHLEAAAGIAGLTKVLLQMKHRQLAPSLHATRINPNIAFEKTAFRVNTELSPWQPRSAQGEIPRIAGISSFGAGGANCHVLVQEYPQRDARAALVPAPPEKSIIPLSARTPEQLLQRARDLEQFIRTAGAPPDLATLACTLQVGREAMDERVAMLVSSVGQLAQKLRGFIAGERDIEDLWRGQARSNRDTLSLLGGDEDFAQTVERWIARRKLSQLAEWWSRGAELDWNRLYGQSNQDTRPARMPLPTYPFAQEKYWVDSVVRDAGPERFTSLGGRTMLHPLLQRNVSVLSRQRFSSTFTGTETFLRDHVVKGQKVLPAVAYLEMARAAVELASPPTDGARLIELRDTVWAQPVVVTGPREVTMALRESEAGKIEFDVSCGDTLHCEGHAVFTPDSAAPRLEIEQLKARMPGASDVSGMYARYTAAGVDYGAAHRAVDAVWVGERQLLARLRLPRAAERGAADYLLHPSILDGALQTCLALAGASERFERPMLPFALDTLRVFAACTPEMYAWVRPTDDAEPGAGARSFDVDLCDAQGRVCVQLHGFVSRALEGELAPATGADHSAAVLHSLVPVWNRVPAPTAAPTRGARLLVAGCESAAWLTESYPEARFLQLAPGAPIEDIQRTLATHSFDHLLWIAPEEDRPLIESQEQGVLATFRLAKALLNLGYAERVLRWTVLTRNTQMLGDEAPAPAHAAIVGFAGSLAREYPDWSVQVLDVDELRGLPAGQCLSWRGETTLLAWRRGEWFSQGLARLSPPPPTLPAYRQNGVYVVIGGAGGIGTAWSRSVIERYDARIVWIGRRERDAGIDEKIRMLGEIGRAPMYVRADATQRDSLQRAFEQIRAVHPRIHGVIHSAIVLKDQSVALLDEATFRAGLSAKVDTSVHMDAVFGGEDLDFVLFFSSLISFTRAAGQSNYSAGCTFADSFARSLTQQRRYPVKIMNWGYWGNVGIVRGDFYNQRMQQMGIGSIEADEAMDRLQTLVGSDFPQLALLKTLDERALEGVALPETVSYLPRPDGRRPGAWQIGGTIEPRVDLGQSALPTEAVAVAGRILAATLSALRICSPDDLPAQTRAVAPWLQRWLVTSLEYAASSAAAASDTAGLEAAWANWESGKSAWLAARSVASQVALLEACLRALPDILTGRLPATDVMFPDSSMRLVEGVYQGHALADYANDALGATLCSRIQQMSGADAGPVRILEIGAGTGGTTARILPLLRPHAARIAEYCYTDLSKAFLNHAEERYRPQLSTLTTAIFDVTQPVRPPLERHRYDFVIATNVLHATPDIRQTLRNAKALLKSGGLLLLNEMSTWSLFSHLTFGLLEGWWLYEDAPLRLAGSPGLAPQSWQKVLADEGFESIAFPATPAHELGQQVIAAASDGRTRQRSAPPAAPTPGAPAPAASAPLAAPIANASLRERLLAYLQEVVSRHLRLTPAQVDAGRALSEYGLDSIIVVGLTNQIRKAFPGIKTTLFFEVRNVAGLADYLLERHADQAAALLQTRAEASARPAATPPATAPAAPATRERGPAAIFDVAIVGLSGRYPQAPNLEEFWRNLAAGRNCISEIPADRWDWREHFDAEKGKAGKSYTKWGGFLERIDKFDPLFFRISPKEAKVMDPQERLFLEASYHAIEDAGYTPENIGARDKVGVFVGVMNARYAPQPLYYSIANRVSFLFDFQGPSMAVDTACSASLTAIHLALESLYSGLSECAIAGGVNLIIDSGHYEALSSLTMLSSGNQCRSFGSEADGFVDAEGVGAIVLKPLSKAEQDGDHIYGVIKASAINAGGKTNGYTVPNPLAQSAVVAKALERAGLSADDISYVEAHGTGTALGDPVEVAGLARVFGPARADGSVCALGSLKSNIGHCEAAAGIAGLTKVLLQLEHAQLVPTLHAEQPNPEIDFGQTPFRIQTALAPWARPRRSVGGVEREIPRIAGISSFGAGGANAHLIVQEYEPAKIAGDAVDGPVAIPLSARTAQELQHKARDLLRALGNEGAGMPVAHSRASLRDIAYTLQVGREPMEERLGFVASSRSELVQKLAAFCAGRSDLEGMHRGRVKRHQEIVSSSAELPSARELPRLIELWVRGFKIDWSRLHGAQRPQRTRLPVYPFGGERYWHTPDQAAPAARPGALAVLHPLLHRNVSDMRQQRYGSTFTGDERFVTAQKLIPAVAFLEMARAAIENASAAQMGSNAGRASLELFNIVWADPVSVASRQEISVALFARDADQLDYEIYGAAADGGHDVVHMQGQAILVRAPAPVRVDVERLAPLLLPVPDGSSQELVLDPLVLDRALQAAGELLGRAQSSFPLALESLRVLRPCVKELYIWVRHAADANDARNIQLDLDLADAHGNVCVQMRGLTYERVSRAEPKDPEFAAIALTAPALTVNGAIIGSGTGSIYPAHKPRIALSDAQ